MILEVYTYLYILLESDAGLPTSRTSSTPNQLSESGSPTSEDSVAYVETDGTLNLYCLELILIGLYN